jgi:hypothetical protein
MCVYIYITNQHNSIIIVLPFQNKINELNIGTRGNIIFYA